MSIPHAPMRAGTPNSLKPNILIFMTDHQQGATISPHHPCITPNALRVQEQGLWFPRTYTPTAHCCPSRASFFTGLYPSRHGVWNNVLNGQALRTGLNTGIRTFSEALRESGYSMAFSGKWHISAHESPEDRGWDVLMAGSVPGERHGWTWQDWESRPRQLEQPARADGWILRPGWGDYRLYGTLETESSWDESCVSRFIDALPSLAASGRPWCGFVGPNGPHDPYIVPEKYLRLYDISDIELPTSYGDSLEDKPRIYRRMARQIWGQLTRDEVKEAVRHYLAYCTWMDSLLGRLLDALEESGCSENTIVICMSDHGDYAGAHGLFAKGIGAFDEAYRIPCAMRWPAGIVNPGRVIDEFVTHADFAPTLLELAQLNVPSGLTGRSLLPFMRGESPFDWPDAVYTQMNGVELYYSQRSVSTKKWKYVFNGFDDDELYDLEADPHELVNLAGSPDCAEVVREMAKRMWLFARREGDQMHNSYITVGLAPYGPLSAF